MSRASALVLDAMGGDHAPLEIVRGGVEYARETGRKLILVGDEVKVLEALDYVGRSGSDVEVVGASEVIEFGDSIRSIRTKRDSSIHVGCRLVRDGSADALVSAGHTGAVMAIAKVIFGLIEGVDRPALPAPMPRLEGGYTVLLDAGANLDCRPEHFRQFAIMGFHYSRRVFGVDSPRVGLLSVGEEDTKGNAALKEVATILRETRVNFIGNVEGNTLFSEKADVVLCDGFVGNVVLKVSEGLAETVLSELRQGILQGPLTRLGALPLRPVFRVLKSKMDYATYGGVPLLGLQRVGVVAHGRSGAKAIRNALKVAQTAVDADMVSKIRRDIGMLHEAELRLGVLSEPAR